VSIGISAPVVVLVAWDSGGSRGVLIRPWPPRSWQWSLLLEQLLSECNKIHIIVKKIKLVS